MSAIRTTFPRVVADWIAPGLRHYPLNTPRASILQRLPEVPDPVEHGPILLKRGLHLAGYYAGRDHVCMSLFWFGDFDPWVDRTLVRLIAPGDVVLDIGANIGATTLVLAQRVGPRGGVLSFEPVPGHADLLIRNCEANGFGNVDVRRIALSDRNGDLIFDLPKGQPGMARVKKDGSDVETFRVRSQTLDEVLHELPIRRIAVCKIDVEGHEAAVLAGANATLASGVIDAIVFERHFSHDSDDDPVFELLRIHGYQIRRIEKGLRRVVYNHPEARSIARVTPDFVAVRQGSPAEKLLHG